MTRLFSTCLLIVLFLSVAVQAAPGGFLSDTNARNRVLEEYRSQAARLESNGQLREALDSWRVVDALVPGNGTTLDTIARLEGKIKSLSATALERGLKAMSQGKTSLAQQQFILVLQLVPGHAEALAKLRQIETAITLQELKRQGAEGPAADPAPVM
jgi:hypothetical protein